MPSKKDFREFCREFDIGTDQEAELRTFLDELLHHVRFMRTVMREQKRVTEIRRDAESQAKTLSEVIEWLYRFDRYLAYKRRKGSELYAPPDAVTAIATAATEHLSPLVDPWFISRWSGIPSDLVGDKVEVELAKFDYERGRDWVRNFTKLNADTVLVMVLEAVRKTLAQAARTMKAETRKGGKDRYEIAPMVLINLAEIYHRLGRTPQREDGKPFYYFALGLVSAIGWHTSWVETYLQQAVNDWSEKHDKSNPARNLAG